MDQGMQLIDGDTVVGLGEIASRSETAHNLHASVRFDTIHETFV